MRLGKMFNENKQLCLSCACIAKLVSYLNPMSLVQWQSFLLATPMGCFHTSLCSYHLSPLKMHHFSKRQLSLSEHRAYQIFFHQSSSFESHKCPQDSLIQFRLSLIQRDFAYVTAFFFFVVMQNPLHSNYLFLQSCDLARELCSRWNMIRRAKKKKKKSQSLSPWVFKYIRRQQLQN